ncbi:MAG: GspH/FimT family pseudopilin [Steroidobacteraceae bacterium]|nr:GspH/FimT family pseudopilin [Steroidobacteraceae bacterium]MBP7013984.1 GspH/FimT family pseudopilin [Steroidobacteraceae bacterium]
MLLLKMHAKQPGFTLIELLFAIALVAVLAGIGLPNLQEFVRNSRMSAAANDIISDFNFARSEAVKRRVSITLCKSQDGAACDEDDADPFNRWIIFVDDEDPAVVAATDGNGEVDGAEVILRDRAVPDSITVVTDADEIRAIFLPTGFPVIETENVNRFVLCDVRGNVVSAGGDSAARAIEVLPTGRPSVFRAVATVTAFGDCP